MGRFRKQHHEVPGLNMAAMPDLIFTVLFFFMIVTHMRQVRPMVHYEIPQGTELEKARKAGMVYLFIGQPIDEQGRVTSREMRLQLNDRIVTLEELGQAISEERAQMPEAERQQMVVSIRADRTTEMGIINDVKQELRKVGALRINYSATSRSLQQHSATSRSPQKHN